MKIVSCEREGKKLVLRTEPELNVGMFDQFRSTMNSRGFTESTYKLDAGAVVISSAWPFDIAKNMEELKTALMAAAELQKRAEQNGE